MNRREAIYKEIENEREYQQGRWGNETDDTLNEPFYWASYISKYSTNFMKGLFPPFPTDNVDLFRESMIKVAALSIAAIESLDRQREENGKAFYEGEK